MVFSTIFTFCGAFKQGNLESQHFLNTLIIIINLFNVANSCITSIMYLVLGDKVISRTSFYSTVQCFCDFVPAHKSTCTE